MMRFLLVCGSGAAGCGARYLVMQAIGQRTFPYSTLIVNLVGSFLMGLVMELSLRIASFPPNVRYALSTGFLGGLTTYSSFNYETTSLASQGASTRALLYVVATMVGCLVAGLLGIWLARRVA